RHTYCKRSEDTMNYRSADRRIAGLLLAAVFTFRTALLGLMLVLPGVVLADDQQGGKRAPVPGQQAAIPGKPAIVLSVASYDRLRSDFLYLAGLAGQGEGAAQVDRLIAVQAGDRGLEGIDRKKPMGAYGWVGPLGDDSSLVLLVPVADQRAFLDLVNRFV